jgi:hypothetical protein
MGRSLEFSMRLSTYANFISLFMSFLGLGTAGIREKLALTDCRKAAKECLSLLLLFDREVCLVLPSELVEYLLAVVVGCRTEAIICSGEELWPYWYLNARQSQP